MLGKDKELSRLQRRIRGQLTDPSNPSKPYRAVEALSELRTTPDERIQTLADIPDYSCRRFADRETMGVRQILDVQDEQQPNGKVFKKYVLGEYKFITYGESFDHIKAIGRGLLAIGARKQTKVLIFSETRYEWLLTAFAAFRHALSVVTLYATLGDEAIKYGINESQVPIVITSYDLLSKVQKALLGNDKVTHVIYFPCVAKSQERKLPDFQGHVTVMSLDELKERGNHATIDNDTLKVRPVKTDLAVIMYTSGSTGTPKGVMIRHENIVAALAGQHERFIPMINLDTDIFICYLPLAHILELCCEILIYFLGMKFGYSSAQTLTDQSTAIKQGQRGDLKELRPHIMCCVPTVLDRIYTAVNDKLSQATPFRRQLFQAAYKLKVKRLEEGLESPFLDRLIFARLNEMVLGGRLKRMMCGGALLSGETQRFIQAALCVSLFQGYGLTETCAAATIGDHYHTSVGRVGHPLVSCEIRLRNWEDAKYRNTDKPNPRGEILIGGKVVACGYFAEASKENENFKNIGGTTYFCTGDIGEIFPDGTIRIIDRKKDLIKLRGGEYVSLAKVEEAIRAFSIVEMSCLCASPSAEYTVLLISPNSKITKYANDHFGTTAWQTLLDDDAFNEKVLQDVQDVCKKGGIERFETPQRARIVVDSWTPESGLVTAAFKLKRKAIEEKYRDLIQSLYVDKPKKTSPSKLRDKRRVAPK